MLARATSCSSNGSTGLLLTTLQIRRPMFGDLRRTGCIGALGERAAAAASRACWCWLVCGCNINNISRLQSSGTVIQLCVCVTQTYMFEQGSKQEQICTAYISIIQRSVGLSNHMWTSSKTKRRSTASSHRTNGRSLTIV